MGWRQIFAHGVAIKDAFDKRFGVKVVDPRFMLGNERNLYEVDWVRYCHATQVGKIEGVWEGFGKHCEQVRKLDRPCVNCDFVSAAGQEVYPIGARCLRQPCLSTLRKRRHQISVAGPCPSG